MNTEEYKSLAAKIKYMYKDKDLKKHKILLNKKRNNNKIQNLFIKSELDKINDYENLSVMLKKAYSYYPDISTIKQVVSPEYIKLQNAIDYITDEIIDFEEQIKINTTNNIDELKTELNYKKQQEEAKNLVLKGAAEIVRKTIIKTARRN